MAGVGWLVSRGSSTHTGRPLTSQPPTQVPRGPTSTPGSLTLFTMRDRTRPSYAGGLPLVLLPSHQHFLLQGIWDPEEVVTPASAPLPVLTEATYPETQPPEGKSQLLQPGPLGWSVGRTSHSPRWVGDYSASDRP